MVVLACCRRVGVGSLHSLGLFYRLGIGLDAQEVAWGEIGQSDTANNGCPLSRRTDAADAFRVVLAWMI